MIYVKLQLQLNTVNDAIKFTKIAQNQNGDIFVKHNSYVVDGTSILGILSLNLSEPVTVEMVEKSDGEANSFLAELTDAELKITKMED